MSPHIIVEVLGITWGARRQQAAAPPVGLQDEACLDGSVVVSISICSPLRQARLKNVEGSVHGKRLRAEISLYLHAASASALAL